MHTKLTLRVETELIEKAKTWAQTHRISLSQAVGEFFAQLPDKDQKGEKRLSSLSPWTRRLVGIVERKGKVPTDAEIRQDYVVRLEAKHR